MSGRVVRIGGAAGAWGDSPLGVEQLLGTEVDYLMMDYLAEVSMSLLARARQKSAEAGYPPDFVDYLRPHLADLKARGIRVVSNAGGVNPQACARALEAAASAQGLELQVAVVEGDDVLPRIDALRAGGVREWRSGATIPDSLLTANAYLGAFPIAAALDAGAQIVITGRCVDSALALGILIHEFAWRADDYDRLAAGSLAGHLLECGPQATGGNFTDWERVPDWHKIGYPIAECHADGSLVLTKPSGSGGLVEPGCVAEQLLYEIADPAAYVLPDVIADFSGVQLRPCGTDRVEVRGARGRAPSGQYKVSATCVDGLRAVAMLTILGPEAARKAERTAAALLERARVRFRAQGWPDFSAVQVDVLGAESSYGEAARTRLSREVVLRLVVEHRLPKALDAFARELGSVGLSCAPGTAGLIGGRPKPTPVVRLFTFLIDKDWLDPPVVRVGRNPPFQVPIERGGGTLAQATRVPVIAESDATPGRDAAPLCEAPLMRVAHARSGDKGDSANVAIICRKRDYFEHLGRVLTPQRMAQHFAGLVEGPVVRYTADGLAAFNFVMENALGGGGMASLRIDPQGKAYGQRALEMRVPVPVAWFDAAPDPAPGRETTGPDA